MTYSSEILETNRVEANCRICGRFARRAVLESVESGALIDCSNIEFVELGELRRGWMIFVRWLFSTKIRDPKRFQSVPIRVTARINRRESVISY